jgi:hypothetical protein
MKTDLLLKLADFLERIPPDRFYMEEWETDSAERNFDGTFDCGFAGCALGWAAHANLIYGLHMEDSSVHFHKWSDVWPEEFSIYEGFAAAMEAFEIDSTLARHLFDPRQYPQSYSKGGKSIRIKPSDVAERIRIVVAQ